MRGSLALSLRFARETFAISWPTVLDAALGGVTKERCDARLDAWSRAVVEQAGLVVEVIGAERRAAGMAYVVMSNHQSLYDIPVLFHVLGPNIRMVAKSELFRVPVFGGAMRAAGFVGIDRSDPRSTFRTFAVARDLIDQGTLVWIAPEGTRSRDGTILPFRAGAFGLAIDARVPILPVTLDGTRSVLPSGSLRSTRGVSVRVTVHPPVHPPASPTAAGARRALMRDVRGAIESALAERPTISGGREDIRSVR